MNKPPELRACKACGSFYCGPIRCRFANTEPKRFDSYEEARDTMKPTGKENIANGLCECGGVIGKAWSHATWCPSSDEQAARESRLRPALAEAIFALLYLFAVLLTSGIAALVLFLMWRLK